MSKSLDLQKEYQSLYNTALGKAIEPWSPGYEVDLPNIGIIAIREVLQGGMGIVYITFQASKKQLYAIKTYRKKFTWNEEAIRLFKEEAKKWILLGKHPNIVHAYSVEIIEGRPHIFLEYIEGCNLRQWLKSPFLSIENRLDVALQTAHGLEYAFEKSKIVHRDIKPENIMISLEGCAKVTDFGLAIVRPTSSDEQLTEEQSRKQTMVGTPLYMAPEQFTDAENVSTQADIYSFGILLYEMITNTLPFQAENLSLLKELHEKKKPKSPREINSKIPKALDNLVLKCLEKNAKHRFNSFHEIINGLKKIYFDVTRTEYQFRTSTENDSLDDILRNVNSLRNMGYYDEAIHILENSAGSNERMPRLSAEKGITLFKAGNYSESIKYFSDAISLNDNLLKAGKTITLIIDECWYIYYLIQAQKLSGAIEESTVKKESEELIQVAEKILDAFIASEENVDENIFILKALIMRESIFHHPEIEKFFRKAIEINPQNYLSHYHFANFLYDYEKFEQALTEYNEVLVSNPRYFEAMQQIGSIHCHISHPSKAIIHLLQALKVNLRHIESLSLLAQQFILIDDYNSAIDTLSKIIQIDPLNYKAMYELGRIKMLDQDYEHAALSFNFAAKAADQKGLMGDAFSMVALSKYCKNIKEHNKTEIDNEEDVFNRTGISAIEYDGKFLWLGYSPDFLGSGNDGLILSDLHGNLVYRFDSEDGLIQNRINCIKSTNYGIFVGVDGGMNLIDLEKGTIRTFNGRNGLFAKTVNDIACHGESIWIATDNGIFSFYPDSAEFNHYGVRHGLFSSHINCKRLAINDSGDICVCSPSRYDLNFMRLPVYIFKNDEFQTLKPPNIVDFMRRNYGDDAAESYLKQRLPSIIRRLFFDSYRKIRRKEQKATSFFTSHIYDSEEIATMWKNFKPFMKDIELAISVYELACINPDVVINFNMEFIFNFGSKLCVVHPENPTFIGITDFDDSSAITDQSITSVSRLAVSPILFIGLSDGRVYSFNVKDKEKKLILPKIEIDDKELLTMKTSPRTKCTILSIPYKGIFIADDKRGVLKIPLDK